MSEPIGDQQQAALDAAITRLYNRTPTSSAAEEDVRASMRAGLTKMANRAWDAEKALRMAEQRIEGLTVELKDIRQWRSAPISSVPATASTVDARQMRPAQREEASTETSETSSTSSRLATTEALAYLEKDSAQHVGDLVVPGPSMYGERSTLLKPPTGHRQRVERPRSDQNRPSASSEVDEPEEQLDETSSSVSQSASTLNAAASSSSAAGSKAKTSWPQSLAVSSVKAGTDYLESISPVNPALDTFAHLAQCALVYGPFVHDVELERLVLDDGQPGLALQVERYRPPDLIDALLSQAVILRDNPCVQGITTARLYSDSCVDEVFVAHASRVVSNGWHTFGTVLIYSCVDLRARNALVDALTARGIKTWLSRPVNGVPAKQVMQWNGIGPVWQHSPLALSGVRPSTSRS